jgi:hypothetical protein
LSSQRNTKMKDNRCIICGKSFDIECFEHTSRLRFKIDKASCYLIYKKLLGIYGVKYIELLDSNY